MEQSFTVRIPRWLVYVLGAVVLIGGGVGAGLALGRGEPSVASAKRSSTSTSTSTSTTTSTAPFAGLPGPSGDDGGGGGGGDNHNGGGGGGDAAAVADPAPPAPPAATASVSKTGAGVCPTVVTWEGHGGTKGYTLQVYHAINPGTVLYNGPVAGVGNHSFDCVAGIPVVGLVRFNANTDTGTVSDTA
jgi:hypothetical protein